ncbi:C40 family peptidase [Hoeflea sp. WL0058]|uniref:C40 family peptidase n=1 Tax=Flavimaribacter sediminis TaxID=2865987 RepID=A0AAE3D0T6_9HYPH|nr:NlpC/P60 family protein [Flavimaribacter sediminis]MBW8638079.1 C40 family peptidase [Flavimaribacter sediminis]
MSAAPDKRLNAYRADLADSRLRNVVDAAAYVTGAPAVIVAPVSNIHARPDKASECVSQSLYGETVRVFEEKDRWRWIQCDADGYVGYVAAEDVGETQTEPTHMVVVPRTFLYDGADLRHRVEASLSMGSRLKINGTSETRGTQYAMTQDGFAVIASHVAPLDRREADYVAVAERFLETPYLWGGRSGFGLDCSGLVQLAMAMAGLKAPRDTDMQAAGVGDAVDPGPDYGALRRGDLVFWKGHVAIMRDRESILHASGHTMIVKEEPLADAVSRIAHLYGPPTGFRRPKIQ